MTQRESRPDLSHPLAVLGSGPPPAAAAVGLSCGVRSGDVTVHEAVLWARGDGPGRLLARLSTGAHVGHVLRGPRVDEASDFTGRLHLTGLAAGRPYDAALWFEAPDGTRGEVGHLGFRTASANRAATSLAWVGAGSGASATYAAVHRTNPDVVVDLGPSVDPTEEPVAQSVEDFRGRHRQAAQLDALRALRADVPFVAVWDDHESHRHWLPGGVLEDERYTEARVDVLATRARRAWQEYQPVRGDDVRRRGEDGFASDRIYRRVARGPLVDLFCLDLRTAPDVALLGTQQAEWLVREASRSTAVWKVLAAHVGPARAGDDTELAKVLRALRDRQVDGVVWLVTGEPGHRGEGVAREIAVGPVAVGFGQARFGSDAALTASLHDSAGAVIWRADLVPSG